MSVDQDLKKTLDSRLAKGEITEADYERLLARLSGVPSPSMVSPNPHYDVTRDGFAVAQVAVGQILRGKYKVEQQLGRGGMGVVYRAQDLMLKKTVALKILPVEIAQQEDAIERLREEAALTMELRHDHIMAVNAFENEGHLAFIVMELVNGPSLSQLLIRANGPLVVDDVLRWGIEACDALAYAHKKKVWHRDIKPGNLMVHGEDRILKLCDFGLATRLRMTMSQVTGRQLSGTPLYMAPEQFRGEKPDHRADIYALAMTLYECLLGEHPWLHAADLSLLVLKKMPDPIPGLPDALNKALLRGLAKDRKTRFAEAQEFKIALEGVRKSLVGRPAVVPTDSILDLPKIGEAPARRLTGPVPPPKPKTPSKVELPKLIPENEASTGKRRPWTYLAIPICLALVVALAIWRPWSGSKPATPAGSKVAEGVADTTPEAKTLKPSLKQALTNMVSIPAGKFFMGCNDKLDRNCQANEKPGQEASVDAFSIQKTEVTVADFRACVEAGKCEAPNAVKLKGKKCNWALSGKDDHPMNCVTLHQAKAYCEWKDARLPTNKEWERTARGTDGRIYPWGNDKPTCSLAVMDGCGRKETQSVGSKTSGASPDGVLDTAGNVYEWTKEGVVRGGGCFSNATKLRASMKVEVPVETVEDDVGFRCATD